MSTQPTTEVSRSEAVESLLLDMTDLKNRAECSLNFAYETLSILTRGVKEGSEKHVQAALVNLDHLAQELLDGLLVETIKLADAAERIRAQPN